MERKIGKNYREGRLPAMAPLANPYVPFQLEDSPRYEGKLALVRGTLFPGLDLPFRGMVNQPDRPMTPKLELQILAFAIQELALYLDTHPEDQEALELYQAYQRLYNKAKGEYVKRFGPMGHRQMTDCDEYTWLKGPWPWELKANMEG